MPTKREIEAELLAPVLELAVLVAQAGAKQRPPIEPPPPLRAFIKFRNNIPAAALRAARSFLEQDGFARSNLSAAISEELVGQAGVLFVARPPGWEETLADLVDDELAYRNHLEGRKVDKAAERELERSLEIANRSQLKLAEQEALALQAKDSVSELQKRHHELDRHLVELRSELAELRSEVVNKNEQLEKALKLVSGATARVRELEIENGSLAKSANALGAKLLQRDDFEISLGRSVEAIKALHASLLLIRDEDKPAVLDPRSAEPPPAKSPKPALEPNSDRPNDRPVPVNRQVVKLANGLLENSFEAADFLARIPMMVFIVDGYNVAKLRWPTLEPQELRDRLVNLGSGLASRAGVSIHFVFDGDGSSVSKAPRRGPGIKVTFSKEGQEADDLILEMIDRSKIPTPVTVVSNDNRVIEGALRRRTNTLSSDAFIEVCSRPAPRR